MTVASLTKSVVIGGFSGISSFYMTNWGAQAVNRNSSYDKVPNKNFKKVYGLREVSSIRDFFLDLSNQTFHISTRVSWKKITLIYFSSITFVILKYLYPSKIFDFAHVIGDIALMFNTTLAANKFTYEIWWNSKIMNIHDTLKRLYRNNTSLGSTRTNEVALDKIENLETTLAHWHWSDPSRKSEIQSKIISKWG